MSIIKGLHAKLIAENVKSAMQRREYSFFESGAFNVNIVGIRASSSTSNLFDDTILLIYRNRKKEWEVMSSLATTDPGEKYLLEPLNKEGAVILVPDQYTGTYRIDIHARNNSKFSHEALCQRAGKVKVWRDKNRDIILDHDEDNVDSGSFGVNIHRAKSSGEADYVGAYSAGCQVFKNSTDYKLFMDVVRRSSAIYGNSFTYTLLEEKDFED